VTKALLALFLLFTMGCSAALPDYALPQSGLKTDEEVAGGDLIRYRVLTRDDFRGKSPQGEAAEFADQMGAQTALLIKHGPIDIKWVRKGDDVEGSVRNLTYQAWMDRSKSWWNPVAPEVYVLQHEQIHFALAEVEARKLDAEAAKLSKRTFRADTPKELRIKIENEMNALLFQTMERLLARSQAFDEETSNVVAIAAQETWWQGVQDELSDLPAEWHGRATAGSPPKPRH
jgi:hypothetical protein